MVLNVNYGSVFFLAKHQSTVKFNFQTFYFSFFLHTADFFFLSDFDFASYQLFNRFGYLIQQKHNPVSFCQITYLTV